MTKIITVINQKGGVGKTTTAHNIGYGLSKKKKKVLLIDLDPQANLTFTMTAKEMEKSIFDVLTGKENINNAIYEVGKVDLIPSTPQLSALDNFLKAKQKEYILKKAINMLDKEYDFIVIDTPPALGILTVNALTASTDTIITAQADIFSLQGIGQLAHSINVIKEYTNKELEIKGILLTRYNKRSILTRDMTENMEEIAKNLGTTVFNTKIRECIAIKESQAMNQDIFSYSPRSNGAKDYNDFVKEYLKGGRLNG